MILIHAPFGRRSHFASVFDHLATQHGVIALDLRGCGQSGMPAEGFRIVDFADDVRAVCRAAGVDRAVLCGHSLGGTVALEVAALEPRLVAGVALLDAVVLFPELVRRQAMEQLVPALAGPGWQEALQGYMAGTQRSTAVPDARRRVACGADRTGSTRRVMVAASTIVPCRTTAALAAQAVSYWHQNCSWYALPVGRECASSSSASRQSLKWTVLIYADSRSAANMRSARASGRIWSRNDGPTSSTRLGAASGADRTDAVARTDVRRHGTIRPNDDDRTVAAPSVAAADD